MKVHLRKHCSVCVMILFWVCKKKSEMHVTLLYLYYKAIWLKQTLSFSGPFFNSCGELAAILGLVDSQVCQASSQDAQIPSKTYCVTVSKQSVTPFKTKTFSSSLWWGAARHCQKIYSWEAAYKEVEQKALFFHRFPECLFWPRLLGSGLQPKAGSPRLFHLGLQLRVRASWQAVRMWWFCGAG